MAFVLAVKVFGACADSLDHCSTDGRCREQLRGELTRRDALLAKERQHEAQTAQDWGIFCR